MPRPTQTWWEGRTGLSYHAVHCWSKVGVCLWVQLFPPLAINPLLELRLKSYLIWKMNKPKQTTRKPGEIWCIFLSQNMMRLMCVCCVSTRSGGQSHDFWFSPGFKQEGGTEPLATAKTQPIPTHRERSWGLSQGKGGGGKVRIWECQFNW